MEFIKLLLFYKLVLLTQDYIYLDKGETFSLHLNDYPISAITQGAGFEIDVSKIFRYQKDIRKLRKEIKELLVGKEIEVVLRNRYKAP